jgi:glycine/D-amino acid oxidase-like deaminating enzyme
VAGAECPAAEPALADGLFAWRLETGRPVPPAAAANAFAIRAHEAGATLQVGVEAFAHVEDGRATGVTIGNVHHTAGGVVVAAGPWSPVDFISPLWGLVVEFELPDAPRHVLEEAGIKALTSAEGAPEVLFSAVTARGISAVGSTFTSAEPDPATVAPAVIGNATRFLPALEGVEPRGMRACARPSSEDGRPLLGPLPEAEGLAIASGHGAWGISLGPASSRRVADQLLGRRSDIPPALSAGRIRS